MTPAEFVPPSGSKLALGATCPASMVLPRTKEEAGDAAELGTAIHAFVEDVARAVANGLDLEVARTNEIAKVSEFARARCEALDLEALDLGAPGALHEVGFSYDVDADVVTYHGTGHAHGTIPSRPGVIVLVADRVVDRPDLDRVDVDDYKTGFLPVPVAGNLQLLAAAVCAARHFGRSKARIRIVKLPEDGRPRAEFVDLDAFDLDLAAERLRGLVEAGREQVRRLAEGVPLEHVQGKGCRYCPSFNACVPSMRAIVMMACAPLNIESEITALIATGTDADAAAAAEALEKWETVAKRIKIAIMSRARNRPIPFADGTVLGERSYEKTKMDGEHVYAVIDSTYGAAAASHSVKKKATKKGIRAAAKMIAAARTETARAENPKAKKVTIDAVDTELHTLLAERGATKTETKKKFDRHKPGETTTEEDDDE